MNIKKTTYVLIYDSGVGGLTTLAQCKALLPNNNYIYYSDHINCPYGNKTKHELENLVLNNINNLIKIYNIKVIVLACNTATTSCINFLRSNLTIPIIGTEPNVIEPTKKGFSHITLLATNLTISQKRTKLLQQLSGAHFHVLGDKILAKLIEEYILRNNITLCKSIQKHIKEKLKYTPKTNAIVLGCTHYVFFKSYIENLGYKCFDGNIGVSKRLHFITSTMNLDKQRKLIFACNDFSHKLKLKRALKRLENNIK